MSRRLPILLIVLCVVALSGAVAARYHLPMPGGDHWLRGLAANEPSASSAQASTEQQFVGTEPLATGARHTATPEPSSLAEWIERYLERNPDPEMLRRELKGALAQLPSETSEETLAEETAAIAALRRAEQTAGADFRALMDQASNILEKFPNGEHAEEVRQLFDEYAQAWDQHDFDEAREFARLNPTNFPARLDHLQNYLYRHAANGKNCEQVRSAIAETRTAWADHSYGELYEFARQYPNDLPGTAERVRRFLEQHPVSRYRTGAAEFLSRFETASTLREYRVRVKSGKLDSSIGRSLSLGPDLAVEVEVAGIKLGRTPIVADSYNPVWNYEYPQSFRWRLGDPVKIRVIDFDYGNRTILNLESPADDPIALRLLANTVHAQGHQLTFECDFKVPTLPAPAGNER